MAILVGLIIVVALGWAGVTSLRDAIAHGDSLIIPLALLAVPLWCVGAVLAAIVRAIVPQLRHGHDRARTLMPVVVAVVLGVGIYGLNRDIPVQRPDAAVTQAVGIACAGQGIPQAASVHTDGSEPNHIVVLDATGAEQGWTGKAALEWRPPTVDDTELVACVDREETHNRVDTCRYDHGSITTLYNARLDFRVVAARSGLELAHHTIVSAPGECPYSKVGGDDDRIEANVSWEQVAAHLASFVRDGTFVDPDQPGSNAAPTGATPAEPTTRPESSTSPAPTLPPAVELRQAVEAGSVAVTARGIGLERLELGLESRSEGAIRVVVNPATVFNPRSSSTQSMVVITKEVVTLEPGEEVTIGLDVACADMNRDTPDSSDGFRLDSGRPSGSLVKLFKVAGIADLDFRVKQFAIWTITDNPTRGGYVGLGYSGVGSGPSKAELQQIRDLFVEAGIDPDRYHAL